MHKLVNMIRLGFLMLAALLPASVAEAAATLSVSPIRVDLSKNQPIAVVRVHNQGAERAVVQLSVQSWSQEDGEDRFADASSIIACPTVATLEPGQEQVVRVGLIQQQNDWSHEGSYRLFIQEVPPPPSADGRQVQLTVRISIPIFVQPTVSAQPGFDWQLEDRGAQGLWLTATNKGNVHALVSGVQVQGRGASAYEAPQHKYVLPGATMAWRIDATSPYEGTLPASVALTIKTDQGTYQEDIAVSR